MNKSSRINDRNLSYASNYDQQEIATRYLRAKKIGRGVKKAEATIIDVKERIMKPIDTKRNSAHSMENTSPDPKVRGRTQVRKSSRNALGGGRYKSMRDRAKSSKQRFTRRLTKIGHNQSKNCFDCDSTPEKNHELPKLIMLENE
jgi:hypothetical protein